MKVEDATCEFAVKMTSTPTDEGLNNHGYYSFESDLDLEFSDRITRLALIVDAIIVDIARHEGVKPKEFYRVVKFVRNHGLSADK